MNSSYPIGELTDSFASEFEGIQLMHKNVPFEKGTIHCFFSTLPNKTSLNDNWRKISNFIALKFQNKLESEFERWNIYLFLLIDGDIGNELKYHIENDTFSSRKIVINPIVDLDKIINEHLLNSDLTINIAESTGEDGFIHNPLIWSILKDKIPKKKISQEVRDSFEEIVEILKNTSNEVQKS
jgi:hypothetical protein